MPLLPPRLSELLEPPHPAIMEAGAGGERLVAHTRLVFWLFIALAPLSAVLAGGPGTPVEMWIALGAVAVAIVFSVIVVLVLRRQKAIRYIGFVTSGVDVSTVTLTLAVVAMAGRGALAVNSQITWTVYLLAILASSLRYDFRICLFTGLLSVAEYVALVWWVTASTDIALSAYPRIDGAGTSQVYQVVRVMLMLASTALALGIVYRARTLVHASGTDRLTGLANRAHFDERFAGELARAQRAQAPLSLALIDLDQFKRFNDQWGHEAGDEALTRVARIAREESRKQDMVARWGGDEIALVLPDTGIASGQQMIERIHGRLAGETWIARHAGARITVSCGLAQFPADGADAEALFAAADRRLLAAKRAGRNRVVVRDEADGAGG